MEGLTELGVAALFFNVGLAADGKTLVAQKSSVLRVMALSALLPMLFVVPLWLWFDTDSPAGHAKILFYVAVLMATGTGVTLRALENLGASRSKAAQVLVGASVLDDIPAVIVLAVAKAALLGQATSSRTFLVIAATLASAVTLLAVAGPLAARVRARFNASDQRSPPSSFLLVAILVACAWTGESLGVSSLLGAFFAGALVRRIWPESTSVGQGLRVLSEILVPLYFVTVGMRLSADALGDARNWGLAVVLVASATIVKLACYFGVDARARAEGVDPWVVAFGLVPRGLPGLVFASDALSTGAIDSNDFAILTLMVALTTVLGLLLLGRRLKALGYTGARGEPEPLSP
jgi:Kef-type K+ transport system membrane component KefB